MNFNPSGHFNLNRAIDTSDIGDSKQKD